MQLPWSATLLLTACAVLKPAAPSSLIDLSHDLSEDTIYWPTIPRFNRTKLFGGYTDKGIWIHYGEFTTGEHGGTHVDAPNHFSEKGLDLNDLPLDVSVCRGVHLDVSSEAKDDPHYVLSLERVKAWEREHGPIPTKSAVLVNFGWSVRWEDPKAYFNSEDANNVSTFAFPSVSEAVGKYLLEERDINVLGTDTASPDFPRTSTYPLHVALLGKNRMIIENLKIPTSLPARGFTLHAAPVRIVGGTGVQTRAYAILDGWFQNTASDFRWPLKDLLVPVVMWIIVVVF